MTAMTKLSIKSLVNREASIGLDVGNHCVKCVVAQKSPSGLEVVLADQLELNSPTIGQPEEAQVAIRSWLSQCGISCVLIYCSLPSKLYEFESLELVDSVDSRQCQDQAQIAMERLLGPSLTEASYDYWTNQNSLGKQLHLTWTSSSFADQLATAVTFHAFRCQAIETPAAAMTRTAPTCQPQCLFVDINGQESSFIFSQGHIPSYIRNRIPFASLTPAQEVSQQLQIGHSAAIVLLSEWGITEDRQSSVQKRLMSILNQWIHSLLFEIKRTIQYLRSRYGAQAIGLVQLIGGAANLKGLDRWIEQQIAIKTVLPILPTAIKWRSANQFGPQFLQSLGLAMRGLSS